MVVFMGLLVFWPKIFAARATRFSARVAALIFCTTSCRKQEEQATSGRWQSQETSNRKLASNKKQDTGGQAGLLPFNFLLCGQK